MMNPRTFKYAVDQVGLYRPRCQDVVGLSRAVLRGRRPEDYGHKDWGPLWAIWENARGELVGTFSLSPYRPREGWRRLWHNV